jgi:hypothetical protein
MGVFDKFELKRVDEVISRTIQVVKMLNLGVKAEEIAEKTELPLEEIMKIKEQMIFYDNDLTHKSMREVWDNEKDSVYDDCYVEPTVPEKVDTSVVSEYIQNMKKVNKPNVIVPNVPVVSKAENILEKYQADLLREGESRLIYGLAQKHVDSGKSHEFIKEALDITQGELDTIIEELLDESYLEDDDGLPPPRRKDDNDEKLYDNLIRQNMRDVWDNGKDAIYDLEDDDDLPPPR